MGIFDMWLREEVQEIHAMALELSGAGGAVPLRLRDGATRPAISDGPCGNRKFSIDIVRARL